MDEMCKHSTCERPTYAKGYCHGHYQRKRNGKDMDEPFRLYGNPEKSFWQKVEKTDGCWDWSGAIDSGGYGHQRVSGVLKSAHRFSYELHFGEVPDGMHVDHVCRNRKCVNPEHLRLATVEENKQNSAAYANSASGVRGVTYRKDLGKWHASSMKAGKKYHLGYFPTVGLAEDAVVEWRRANMPFSEMDKVKEN